MARTQTQVARTIIQIDKEELFAKKKRRRRRVKKTEKKRSHTFLVFETCSIASYTKEGW